MAAAEPLGPVIDRIVESYLRQHGPEARAAWLDATPRPRTGGGAFARYVPFWRFVDAVQDPGVGTGLRREYIRAEGSMQTDVALVASLNLEPPFNVNMRRHPWEVPVVTDHDLVLRKIEALAEKRPDLMRELAVRMFEPHAEDDDPVLIDVHPKLVEFWDWWGYPHITHPDALRPLRFICWILVSGHGSPETAIEFGMTPELRMPRTS